MPVQQRNPPYARAHLRSRADPEHRPLKAKTPKKSETAPTCPIPMYAPVASGRHWNIARRSTREQGKGRGTRKFSVLSVLVAVAQPLLEAVDHTLHALAAPPFGVLPTRPSQRIGRRTRQQHDPSHHERERGDAGDHPARKKKRDQGCQPRHEAQKARAQPSEAVEEMSGPAIRGTPKARVLVVEALLDLLD